MDAIINGQIDTDMKPASSTGVTQLLIQAGTGDRAALDEMLPLVYGELRRLANFYLSKERPGHTLQPTALVHEAYLRLVDQQHVNWKNRAQFFGLAAEMMRRILMNHARDRAAGKRGGKAERISLSRIRHSTGMKEIELIALDEALKQLTAMDPRKSRIVELKFFSGLTTEEIAEVLQISLSTVEREWTMSRAWLFRWMKGKK
ncbi:sigma-70 family RNA polymerase sigma factor [bacterium]|nr:sigma-70 family RNA polymerase sigma factor [bacterium]